MSLSRSTADIAAEIATVTKLRMTRLVQEDPNGPIYVEFSAQLNGEGADESATEDEKAIAQAKADAEADAAADAHAREHAHEPHANGYSAEARSKGDT